MCERERDKERKREEEKEVVSSLTKRDRKSVV